MQSANVKYDSDVDLDFSIGTEHFTDVEIGRKNKLLQKDKNCSIERFIYNLENQSFSFDDSYVLNKNF